MCTKLRILGGMVLLSMLSSCGPRYHSRCLDDVIKPQRIVSISKDQIAVSMHRLNRQEAHYLFDGRGDILYKGSDPLYAVHIGIQNNRDQEIYLTEKNINMPLVTGSAIASRLHNGTRSRVITISTVGMAAALVTFLGASYITLFGAVAGLSQVIKLGYATLALSGAFFLGTPTIAILQGTRSSKANEAISVDLNEKGLVDSIRIASHEERHFVVFVRRKQYHDHWRLVIRESASAWCQTYSLDVGGGLL